MSANINGFVWDIIYAKIKIVLNYIFCSTYKNIKMIDFSK